MDDLNLISQKFFGTKLDETFKQVLITNVEPIFLGIRGKGVVIRENKGFYPTSCLKISKKTFRLIKITPGNVILDVLKVIGSRVEKIFFIGIVGSLNEQKTIGEIVIPSEAVSLSNLSKPIMFWDQNRCFSGKICQVDGLIQEIKIYQRLLHKKVDFLDMESYYLATFGRKNNKKVKFIGVISDKPFSNPFYKITKPIKINYDTIISLIKND